MYREPRTKEDVLNRMTSMDFDGNLKNLGENVQLKRIKRHVLQIFFGNSGQAFNLTVHKPRPDKPRAKKAAAPATEAEAPAPAKKKATRRRTRH